MATFVPRSDWKNLPDQSTPIKAEDMNRIEAGVAEAISIGESVPTPPAAPTADTLVGATATGKAVMKATDGAAARTAIGAGTSSLKTGSTAADAMPGNTVIPAATPAGTRSMLDGGTDTTQRSFAAKDINEFVAAQIAAAATG